MCNRKLKGIYERDIEGIEIYKFFIFKWHKLLLKNGKRIRISKKVASMFMIEEENNES